MLKCSEISKCILVAAISLYQTTGCTYTEIYLQESLLDFQSLELARRRHCVLHPPPRQLFGEPNFVRFPPLSFYGCQTASGTRIFSKSLSFLEFLPAKEPKFLLET